MISLNPEIEKYILENTSPEEPILAELSRKTYIKTVHPQMLAGHLIAAVISSGDQTETFEQV